MSTLSDIAQWASMKKLKRDDLQEQAEEYARDVYLLVCARVPFDELQQTSPERAVTTATSSYSISDLDPALAGIVSIRMAYGATGPWRRLGRGNARQFDQLNPTTRGRPSRYARWGSSLEFDRIPDNSVYTYRIRYWSRPTIAVEIAETVLITPLEWDELLKWETLWRLYTHLERHQEAASLVQPMPMPRQASPKRTTMFEIGIIPRLWNDLLSTTSQRENVDEDFSINPVVSTYTSQRYG